MYIESLVAVELQFRSDSLFLFLHCLPDCVQYKTDSLPGTAVSSDSHIYVLAVQGLSISGDGEFRTISRTFSSL